MLRKIKKRNEKMKREMLITSAMFMIFLVVTIPICSADAYAQKSESINIKSIYGKDKIEKIRRAQDDFITVVAEVWASSAINAGDVKFIPTGGVGVSFTTCNIINPPYNYNCTYISSTGTLSPGIYPFKACIGIGPRCEQSKAQSEYYVDGVPPKIVSFDINPKKTNGKNLTLTYKVEDRVCSTQSCAGKCSGISKIEIIDSFDNNKVIKTVTINSDYSKCTAEGTDAFSIESAPNGARSICIKVYDMLNQPTQITDNTCKEITKDNTAPVIGEAGIYDATGTAPLNFVRPAGTPAKILMKVTKSTYFNIAEAKADLSALGLGTHNLGCSGTGNNVVCQKDISINKAVSGSVVFSVKDEGGNNAQKTISFSSQEDSIAPVLDTIITNHAAQGVGYLGPNQNNNIIAIINETGSGFFGSNVNINPGTGAKRANCTQAGGRWECTIFNVAASSDAMVSVSGSDDAGNAFSGSRQLAFDNQKPVFVNITLFNLAANDHCYFATGDEARARVFMIDNTAILDDNGIFNAYGKFNTGSADFVKANSCTNATNVTNGWVCEWELSNLVSGAFKAYLNISDIVGNTNTDFLTTPLTTFNVECIDPLTDKILTIEVPNLEVYDVESNESPDYWEGKVVSVSPFAIDVKTLQAISQGHDIWFNIKLNPKNENTKLLSLSFTPEKCWGNAFENYVSMYQSSIIRPTPTSLNPWIKFHIPRATIENRNKLAFNCNLTIVSLHNGKISQPEEEKIHFEIPLVEVDEISEEVWDEIKSIEEGWLVKIGETMNTLQKLVSLAEQLCGVIGIIASLLEALAIINLETAWTQPIPALNVIGGAAEASAAAQEGTLMAVMVALNKFCSFVACTYSNCGSSTGSNTGTSNTKSSSFTCKYFNNIQEGISGFINKVGLDDVENLINNNNGKNIGARITQFAQGDIFGGISGKTLGGKGIEDLPKQEISLSSIFWSNPKQSLILSLVFLCLPGVINNLNKMSEIECQYLLCLAEAVPQGMPIIACTKLRSYQWCMFVYGEIFNILPFAAFIRGVIQQMIAVLMNPIGLIVSYLFWVICGGGIWEVNAVCRGVKAASALYELYITLQQIADNKGMFDFKNTICKKAKEAVDKLEEETDEEYRPTPE